MKKYVLGLLPVFLSMTACSPLKMPVSNQYQLAAYSEKKLHASPKKITIWVTPPEASAGYQTAQMMYVEKPYQLDAFSKNAWANPPAEMLYPLVVQSLQKSGSFKAVLSSSYSQGADYRLDTQLLKLKQNFLKRPSVLEFAAKVVLLRMEDNKVIASKVFSFNVPCAMNTPYGGVVAANQATVQFTSQLSAFLSAYL